MRNIFIILLLISSVGVILSTIFMEPKAEGMGSITGGHAHMFNHQSRGKEKLLNSLTIIFGVVFAISTVLLTIIS